jgi:hypothetical protein
MATLEELADKLNAARKLGVETGKAEDRLRGGRLWTEFVEAALAQGMTEDQAERYLRKRKAR